MTPLIFDLLIRGTHITERICISFKLSESSALSSFRVSNMRRAFFSFRTRSTMVRLYVEGTSFSSRLNTFMTSDNFPVSSSNRMKKPRSILVKKSRMQFNIFSNISLIPKASLRTSFTLAIKLMFFWEVLDRSLTRSAPPCPHSFERSMASRASKSFSARTFGAVRLGTESFFGFGPSSTSSAVL
jgi:hypothetical protein